MLTKYHSYCLHRASKNLFDQTKPNGNRPDNASTKINIIHNTPSLISREKMTDLQKEVYDRSYNIIFILDIGRFYKNFGVTDEAMGID